MSTTSNTAIDLQIMQLALAEARKGTPREGAFCVGCVMALESKEQSEIPIVISAGYSRELEGNTHAEANALKKLRDMPEGELKALCRVAGYDNDIAVGVDGADALKEVLRVTSVYTTMEPCSVRTSGLAPCADALTAAKVKRVVIGVGEPDDFVKCEGAEKLKDAGVEVVWLKGMERDCLEVARRE